MRGLWINQSNEDTVPTAKKSCPSSKISVILFSIIYIIAFSSTLIIHNVFTRPFQQHHGPTVRTRMAASIHEENDSTISQDITDGRTITSILMGEMAFPTPKTARLQFHPGAINLTQPQVLHYCYADPTIYKLHYPISDRQVTSFSDTYNLVLLLAESGNRHE